MSKVVTIVGQGYVGLPLAQAAARAGWKVWGLDTSAPLVEALNSGKSHVDDLTDEDIDELLNLGYEAVIDPSCISNSDVIVVCVPTPLGEAGSPDLSAVRSATTTVGEHLRKGATYILESTTYPGTTENICIPLLEHQSGMNAGLDFFVAYSPERVDPGSTRFGIKNTPKLVGGIDEGSTNMAVSFYADFIDEVVPVKGAREAETAKLLENTFRHVNIALVNEMAKFCNELDIDIWEVIRGAATKPFGFMKFTPGPGVGGHCIPIDPNYLSFEVRKQLGYPFRFVELAQEINNSMPVYVASRAAQMLNEESKPVKGSNILILGVTYKPNIADQRESPAVPVAQALLRRGAKLSFHDPHIDQWHIEDHASLTRVIDLEQEITNADLVVLLQSHTAYDVEALAKSSKIFFDSVGATKGMESKRL